ncbi:hypothetical protein BC940DRAFT_298764 [Gongronella butleri]|nr:hypothetical protein BC940DRAFT_298764 [Gongronella butleri]
MDKDNQPPSYSQVMDEVQVKPELVDVKQEPFERPLPSAPLDGQQSASSQARGMPQQQEHGQFDADVDDGSPYKNAIIEQRESNSEIRWSGLGLRARRIHLKTSNAKIQLQGRMEAWKSVDVESANGKLQWTGDYIKARRVNFQTSNSTIELQGRIEAPDLRIVTSNAKIQGDKLQLVAVGNDSRVEIITSNAKINVPHIYGINDELVVKTSSGSVDLGVHSDRPAHMDVRVQTSHAKVVLHMPAAFAGNFKLSTSSRSQVVIEDPQNAVVYDQTQLQARQGSRFNGRGELRVNTKDGDIFVFFDL